MKSYFKSGSWNVICDRCGNRYKAEELVKEWTGLMVCSNCFEVRHPQDFIRIPKDDPSVPWSRPETPIDAYVCTYITAQGLADIGVADCARADND
jgi:hypothetical protein